MARSGCRASSTGSRGENGGFPKLGVPFNNKDYRILGSLLGSPDVWKLPNASRLGVDLLLLACALVDDHKQHILGGDDGFPELGYLVQIALRKSPILDQR